MDAEVQLGQALQGGQLVLRLFSGCGPATAHHTAGVHPAGARGPAPLGLWTTRREGSVPQLLHSSILTSLTRIKPIKMNQNVN